MIDVSTKKKHEKSNNRIRSLYGHSLTLKIEELVTSTPEFLYRETTRRFLDSIKSKGLITQKR